MVFPAAHASTTAAGGGKSKKWQPWATAGGSVAATEVFQDSSLWLDLSNTVAVRIAADISFVSGSAALTLETSNSADGPWSTVNSGGLTSVAKDVLVCSSASDDETYKVRRYLRWKCSGGAANWEICFRLQYEVL